MSSDKRSVATDALEVLGTIIPPEKEVGRDAIHLATLCVTSDVTVYPSQHVGINGAKAHPNFKHVGIVDPFLKMPIMPGEKFLVVIYPRTIESLRHVWSHPDIPEEGIAVTSSKTTIPTIEDLIAALDKLGRTQDPPVDGETLYTAMYTGEEYIHFSGTDAHGRIDIPNELWEMYDIIHTGRSALDPREGGDGIYFSCSC
jgi:hypothetical protein